MESEILKAADRREPGHEDPLEGEVVMELERRQEVFLVVD